jgi:hypothetical protein
MALLRLTISNFSVASRGDNRLDVIEKAIRSAFEKGNAEDKGFREKVYRSAFAALDRALQQNPNVTVEVAIKRRKALQAKITEIEAGGAVELARHRPGHGRCEQDPQDQAPAPCRGASGRHGGVW